MSCEKPTPLWSNNNSTLVTEAQRPQKKEICCIDYLHQFFREKKVLRALAIFQKDVTLKKRTEKRSQRAKLLRIHNYLLFISVAVTQRSLRGNSLVR